MQPWHSGHDERLFSTSLLVSGHHQAECSRDLRLWLDKRRGGGAEQNVKHVLYTPEEEEGEGRWPAWLVCSLPLSSSLWLFLNFFFSYFPPPTLSAASFTDLLYLLWYQYFFRKSNINFVIVQL